MSFEFENGGGLTVSVNGTALGGVSYLRRRTVNSAGFVYQFLTDKPVARIPKKRYELLLHMRCKNGCVFDGAVTDISVADGCKTETYTQCCVKRLESRAKAFGAVEYTVLIEADERSVSYE